LFSRSIIFALLISFSHAIALAEAPNPSQEQTVELRNLCKQAQSLEQELAKLRQSVDNISQKEKTSAPVVRDIYKILARCFTVLFDMQRFSHLLVLNQETNKNDFVRGSIVMKNFATYFKSIGSQLGKTGIEINKLKQTKRELIASRAVKIERYESVKNEIDEIAEDIAKHREENIIQDDVVYHIASKSESLEELDAELEAENAVGVLKNTKIATKLSLAYPVSGKIVSEFGDKGINSEMLYYIAFETSADAVVTSPAKGFVVFTGKFLNYGNMIIISNGEYRIFLYGLDAVFVTTGSIVEIGDYIGKMPADSSANPIIKMELKKSGEPLDPRHWLLESIEKDKQN
jgi:septal ring factor EnvC (AmiA/AmiB activator)